MSISLLLCDVDFEFGKDLMHAYHHRTQKAEVQHAVLGGVGGSFLETSLQNMVMG
jgi:hypothetical protein